MGNAKRAWAMKTYLNVAIIFTRVKSLISLNETFLPSVIWVIRRRWQQKQPSHTNYTFWLYVSKLFHLNVICVDVLHVYAHYFTIYSIKLFNFVSLLKLTNTTPPPNKININEKTYFFNEIEDVKRVCNKWKKYFIRWAIAFWE